MTVCVIVCVTRCSFVCDYYFRLDTVGLPFLAENHIMNAAAAAIITMIVVNIKKGIVMLIDASRGLELDWSVNEEPDMIE